MHVYGSEICGDKKHDQSFVSTGQAKGHYPVYVCDKQPHSGGQHADSKAGKTW